MLIISVVLNSHFCHFFYLVNAVVATSVNHFEILTRNIGKKFLHAAGTNRQLYFVR